MGQRPTRPEMLNLPILAGGYTSTIVSYNFNADANSLTMVGQSTTGDSPSWIASHPTNKSILYAVNEIPEGALQSFTVGGAPNYSLTFVSTASSGGNGPAFAAPLPSGQVAVMNYGGGNGLIIPTTDPLHFDNSSANLITFPAAVSHPHQAVQNGNEVLVPDLGADKIWRLVPKSAATPGDWGIQGFIQQPAGSGPRHIAIQDGNLYTLHETASTLTSQPIPTAPNGTSNVISSMSIVPPNPPFNSTFFAAEILFPTPNPVFTERYIYVSNRNTGNPDPRGDAITIFKATKSGQLTLVGYVFTGLNQIRGMALGGPYNKYLVAGGAGGGGVAVFERNCGGANLTLRARNTDVATRTSFVILG